MKKKAASTLLALVLAGTVTLLPCSADAARMGGGRSFGSQPSMRAPAPRPAPAQPYTQQRPMQQPRPMNQPAQQRGKKQYRPYQSLVTFCFQIAKVQNFSLFPSLLKIPRSFSLTLLKNFINPDELTVSNSYEFL